MKNIDELTEQEILALNYDDIQLLIKRAKAEAGIKLDNAPIEPKYEPIPLPDMTVYYSDLLGNSVSFIDITVLNKLIDFLLKSTTGRVDYDYNKGGYEYSYFKSNKLKDKTDTVRTVKVYSKALYDTCAAAITSNKVIKEKYEDLSRNYKKLLTESKEITDNINDKVSLVKSKYDKLERYCNLFINEYLPLANNDINVAMSFLNKAYLLTEEERTYVITNYADGDSDILRDYMEGLNSPQTNA